MNASDIKYLVIRDRILYRPHMRILSIETSCDETALAIVEADGGLDNPNFKIINEIINSQIDIHKEYGGVFPAMAKREHNKNLIPLLEELSLKFQITNSKIQKSGDINNATSSNEILKSPFAKATEGTSKFQEDVVVKEDVIIKEGVVIKEDVVIEIKKILEREPELCEKLLNFVETHNKPQVDLIAVTYGPGLEPCLWAGINFAKALSVAWNIPVVPANHMEGHMTSILINQNGGNSKFQIPNSNNEDSKLQTTFHKPVNFPALSLLISGGHTELVLIKNWGEYKVIGRTLDDAVGEAYDKVARLLGISYPGGPEVAKLAEEAREKDLPYSEISFPRPMINSKNYDFSFSGLKTSVLYKTQELGDLSNEMKKVIAREFEQAIIDVLKKKVANAIDEFDIQSLIVGGGVIANTYIRENLEKLTNEKNIPVFFPEKGLSTDNAVMIAMAGYIKSFREKSVVNPEIKAEGNLTF